MGKIKTKSFSLKLALTDDLKQSVALLNTETSNLMKSISEADKMIVKVRTDASTASKLQQAQGKITTAAENLAKDLGVAVSNVGGYSEALKAYDNLEKAIEKAKDY
jgi:hypothetical protein